MKKKILFITILLVTCFLGAPRVGLAGTLDEVQTAVNNYYASGAISDIDIKATLSEIVSRAKAAPDAQAEAAYRGSFIDIVNAFAGSSITAEAAAELVRLAR
jgi:hypothetical protein